jgi:hypothetical protein
MPDLPLLSQERRRPRRMSGQKPPLKPKEVWAIRARLQIRGKPRDLVCLIWPSTASDVVVTWGLAGQRYRHGWQRKRSCRDRAADDRSPSTI